MMATQIQSTKLNMFQTVENHVDTNSITFYAIPGFEARYQEFESNLIQLFQLNEDCTTDGSGASAKLKQLRQKLIKTTFSIGSKVTAYALLKEDQALMSEVNFTKSNLKLSTYQNLVSKAEVIYNRANDLVTELADHKVTPEILADFKLLVDECRKSIPSTRVNINKKATSGKNLAQLIKANLALLDEMDTFAEVIYESDIAIYEGYKKARRIINLPTTRQAVVGKITEASSNTPLKGATISFYPYTGDQTLKTSANGNGNASPKPILTKKSAKQGGFKANSMPDGMYTVEIKRTGFKTLILTVAVSMAETTKLEVEMEKV